MGKLCILHWFYIIFTDNNGHSLLGKAQDSKSQSSAMPQVTIAIATASAPACCRSQHSPSTQPPAPLAAPLLLLHHPGKRRNGLPLPSPSLPSPPALRSAARPGRLPPAPASRRGRSPPRSLPAGAARYARAAASAGPSAGPAPYPGGAAGAQALAPPRCLPPSSSSSSSQEGDEQRGRGGDPFVCPR